MHKDSKTGATVLNKTEARQAGGVGLIWVLAGSLGLAAVVAAGLLLYY